MSGIHHCWKCGAALASDLPLPLARLAECQACRAELHVCRMCEFFDPAVASQCREPVAEPVSDKQRANFCGWFRIRSRAGVASRDPDPAVESRRQLESLFGIDACGGEGGEERSAEDIARERLEDLFCR